MRTNTLRFLAFLATLWMLGFPLSAAADNKATPVTTPTGVTGSATQTKPGDQTQPPALTADQLCNQPTVNALTAADVAVEITPDPQTRWQPPGGEVRFRVKNMPSLAVGSQIVACLRTEKEGAYRTAKLRVVDVGNQNPSDSSKDVTLGIGIPEHVGTFQQMDLVVIGQTAATAKLFGFKETSYVTSRWPAGVISVAVACIFWGIMFALAQKQGVRGDVILKIIATRDGYASLSQLQIIIWTFVIGAGEIYVVCLTGAIINISLQALALLGISSLTTLGALLPTASSSTASSSTAPSVSGLEALSIGATRVVLGWYPVDSATPAQYLVRRSDNGGTSWADVSVTSDIFFAISGLAANTDYQFQVIARVGGLNGPPQQGLPVRTAGADGPAPVMPTNLVATISNSDASANVQWASAATGLYLLQYREDEEATWSNWTQPIPATSASVALRDLDQDAIYWVRVSLVDSGGWSGWTLPKDLKTPQRLPRWADLIIWKDQKEVDVTRVQMLLFTLIAASFVALKIVDVNAIPEIPATLLALMGLSNGVYLTARFIPTNR